MKEKIKLFVDGHSFDKEFQGVQVFISGLYQALSATCHDLDIYVGATDKENIRKRLPFIPEQNILLYKKRRLAMLRYLFDIPALIRQHAFQFAHFQYISPSSCPGCRYIVTLHDVLFNDFKADFPLIYRSSRNILFGRSIREAWLKTTVSSYSQERIAFHYKIPPSTIHLLPNGVCKDWGNHYTHREAGAYIEKKYGLRNFILCLSRIEPRKNQLMLLKQFLELRLFTRGISLVFIGSNSIPVAEFERLLRNLPPGQSAFIRWYPQVTQKDAEAFYRACRLFVYPSKAEGFGIPPLEAALCKVPVLCSSATAMGDFSFFDPYRFQADDEKDLGKKINLMLGSPPDPNTLHEIADKIRKKYSWERTAATFYSLLKSKDNTAYN